MKIDRQATIVRRVANHLGLSFDLTQELISALAEQPQLRTLSDADLIAGATNYAEHLQDECRHFGGMGKPLDAGQPFLCVRCGAMILDEPVSE